MGRLKIGAASVTFRSKTIEEVIEICKKEQVGYIEWGADVHVKTLADAQKAKELCDAAGINISSYGSYYRAGNKDSTEWSRICGNASAMGAASVRVWLGSKGSAETSEEEYKLILEDCREMCDVAKSYGLIVSPECHDNTFNDNTQAILRFVNELDRDNFRTYFQSRYFCMEYDLDRIDKTFDYVLNMHVSYSDLKREQMFRKKDSGYLDTLLKKMISKNFDGIVILEFTEDEREKAFAEDIAKLKKY